MKTKAILLILSTFLCSCQFQKPNQNHETVITNIDDLYPIDTIVQAKAYVSWKLTDNAEEGTEEEPKIARVERRVVKDTASKHYHLHAPVTVPAIVPDEIDLEIGPPFIVESNLPLIAEITGSFPSISDWTYSFSGVPKMRRPKGAEKEHFYLKISGLRAAVSDFRSDKLVLRVTIREAVEGSMISTLFITILTPPTEIEFKQFLPEDTDDEVRKLSESLKILESPARKLHLLQIVEVKNNSPRRAEVTFPIFTDGRLEELFDVRVIHQHTCSYSVTTSVERVVREGAVVVLPLRTDLDKIWMIFINKNKSHFSVLANKEESAFVAIFGSGEFLDGIAEVGRSLVDFQPVEVTSSCRSIRRACNPVVQPNDYESKFCPAPILVPNADTAWHGKKSSSVELIFDPTPEVEVRNSNSPEVDDPMSRIFSPFLKTSLQFK